MRDVDFDVGIIGGGPAGSAAAAYLARSGVSCVILESAIFPRPHVGESLVPATTRVFRELDFLPEMERLGFIKKYGATWTSDAKVRPYEVGWDGLDPDCDARAPLDPSDILPEAAVRFAERPQPGVDQNHTYHVDRGKFDQALLLHAHAAGAKVYEGIRVKHVDFGADEKADPELTFELGRTSSRLRVRTVLDASGRAALVGRQLKLRRTDPHFDQYAIHSWFAGYDRQQLRNADHIHIHFLADRKTWIWQIPITEEVTSLGVVTQKAHFRAAGAERKAFFYECLRSRPDIGALVDGAERVQPIREEADYSYAMTRFAGERFMLLGDAARFVDPIFSSGVSIALTSARFATQDLIRALEHGGPSRDAFSSFETTMKRGVSTWYEFICLYYRLNLLFTYFIGAPRHRIDMLKLLQGDVYDDERPEVLDKMRALIAQVESNPSHRWHQLLSDVSSAALAEAAS